MDDRCGSISAGILLIIFLSFFLGCGIYAFDINKDKDKLTLIVFCLVLSALIFPTLFFTIYQIYRKCKESQNRNQILETDPLL